MSSTDSGIGESTPSMQRRLFAQGSSSKRNLFQTKTPTTKDPQSGEDSDLGPMSPLTRSEAGSCTSSPGRSYHSPFTTPENSPTSQQRSWDRLRPMSRENYRLSPFSSLKRITREARNSPRRRMFTGSANSPKSSLGSPENTRNHDQIPETPEKMELVQGSDAIIPETPQKDEITETPKRDKSLQVERKLITPLGSVCKSIIVPPLHRRKSLGVYDSDASSPEQNLSLKRHLHPADDNPSASKLLKLDDSLSIPRARASLFPEEKSENENVRPNFTLSTKSFYKTAGESVKRHSMCFGWRSSEPKPKKRHSLPSNNRASSSRRSGGHKKSKFGEINAGVMHGIKRPKPRRSLVKSESPKDPKDSKDPKESKDSKKTETSDSSPEMKKMKKKENGPVELAEKVIPVVERPPSPVIDHTKRFFKTNRTLKPQSIASVTVNKNIKLKVTNGRIELNEKKKYVAKPAKKAKMDISFDATDLTVDEPSFSQADQNDVTDILKILEDDWADDEYDTMGPLACAQAVRAPKNAADVMMSPGSVLSDMTSSMNIEDQVSCGEEKSEAMGNAGGSEKWFPLFNKGYKPVIMDYEFDKKASRGMKRQAWQLSSKANGGADQYQLDAGQKKFGTTQCLDCGIVYQIGEPEDENAHLNFHNSFKTLKFNGWKNERVVQEDPLTGSRVITIEKTDSKANWKKVEDVLAVVDRDLGLADMELTDYHDKKIYLYIRNKTILGVLIAETVKSAHAMIPDLVEFDCCEAESTPVKCGVNVIWTAMSHRRQHIATKLLDAMRTNYYYGYILSLDDIAFSMPTPSGKIFAEKYMKTRNFKVYS